jgi:hypothetical protein
MSVHTDTPRKANDLLLASRRTTPTRRNQHGMRASATAGQR